MYNVMKFGECELLHNAWNARFLSYRCTFTCRYVVVASAKHMGQTMCQSVGIAELARIVAVDVCRVRLSSSPENTTTNV